MCMPKTPEVAYCSRLLETTAITELLHLLQEAPLTTEERELLQDMRQRVPLKELAEKYSCTVSGIAKKKQRACRRLHRYALISFANENKYR